MDNTIMQKRFSVIVTVCSYTFLALPFFIFALLYLKPLLGIPAAICIGISFVLAVRTTNIPCDFSFSKNEKIKLLIVFLVILIWVFMSGIGKFVWQNPPDLPARNTMFKMLVEKPWPVSTIVDGKEYKFVYYFAFWLPAALVGKVLGLGAGFVFQYIWAVLGVSCAFMLVCLLRNKITFTSFIIFIFFSGLDYIGVTLHEQYILNPVIRSHIEWWSRYFQYSSMTTQLFWVFNQIIPAWVAVSLVLTQKNNKNIVFIAGTLFLNATIPFMGLLPVAAYIVIRNINANSMLKKGAASSLRDVFTFQNIAGGGIAGIVSFLFFASNMTSQTFSLLYSGDIKYFLYYVEFIVLEAGVYLVLIFERQKRNPLFYIIAICLLCFPLFYIPDYNFVIRGSIPALFVLMLMVIDELETLGKSKKRSLLIIVLIVGSITPLAEIRRTVYHTLHRDELPVFSEERTMKTRAGTAKKDGSPAYTYLGYGDSFFFKYLARKN